jgi:succinyl-CoA synthetase alpha subunit
MAVLVNKHTRLIVQGITGHEGLFHTAQMRAYGTNVLAGVSPGKGGSWEMGEKIPVFDSVKLAVEATGLLRMLFLRQPKQASPWSSASPKAFRFLKCCESAPIYKTRIPV